MDIVWIVDDDPFYQSYLAMYLNTIGYTTKALTRGEDCVEHLREKPLAIILDYDLGSALNGIDILREIKQHTPSVSVILISGTDRANIVSEGFRSGSDDFIQKDSASLIRIKLRLEKITRLKRLRKLKRNARIRRTISIAIGASLASIITYIVLTT